MDKRVPNVNELGISAITIIIVVDTEAATCLKVLFRAEAWLISVGVISLKASDIAGAKTNEFPIILIRYAEAISQAEVVSVNRTKGIVAISINKTPIYNKCFGPWLS